MIVKIDKDACIGCGACQAIADEVFELNDEGLAEVKENMESFDKMSEDLKTDVMDALEGCPTDAILKEEK